MRLVTHWMKARLKTMAMLAVVFGSTVSMAQAQTASDCQIEVESRSVKAELCAFGPTERLVRVTILRTRFESPLVVQALFGSENKFWDRIWVSRGDRRLQYRDQRNIRKLMLSTDPATLDPSVRAVVDFLGNFVEPGTRLEAFDRKASKARFRIGSILEKYKFTLICDAIGQFREANFFAHGQKQTVLLLVGDKDTRCRGRCGGACEDIYQWYTNQYTQECLDHDACHDVTGEQLGQCKEEFWAAAAGYAMAPDCE